MYFYEKRYESCHPPLIHRDLKVNFFELFKENSIRFLKKIITILLFSFDISRQMFFWFLK